MDIGIWAGLAVVTAAGVSTAVTLGVVSQANDPISTIALAPAPETEVVNASSQDSWRMPETSPWAPGTSVTITATEPVPGETISVGHCTVAYSFTAGERAYAVTASHCGSPGDLVWSTSDELSVDFEAPVGTFSYSDLYSPDTNQLDVGIIEIISPDYPVSAPNVQAVTLVADELVILPDVICKYGTTTGETCGKPLDSTGVELLTDSDGVELRAVAATAEMCARAGDSGGPVYADLDGQRVIVGLVSGTRDAAIGQSCEDTSAGPMILSYTAMPDIQEVIDRVVPDADYRID
ncbi:trypsin-like serine protease [Corynebacterium alimapuense]|uniref:Trypsin n=1 Tax=Corynebacterium alimapuense TaxID=1576874 RepID=A0A3M8K9H3_9CORY|nr:trypsin-like serine protease [Corynebacterium alimapuense]RNE49539.1 trypsin [Corynebacterium alimapuense]